MSIKATLSDFTRLNDSVHFYQNGPNLISADGRNKDSPALILMLSWGGAPLNLARKYTDAYKRIFPASPILLIQTEFLHILGHSKTSQDIPLKPALDIVRKYVHGDGSRSEQGRLLIHLFSNGGSYKLIELAKRYRATYGHCMPIDTLIIDSAPGISTLLRSFRAISYALPRTWFLRLPLQLLLMIGLIIQRTLERMFLGEGLMRIFRRQMNDPDLIDPASSRCYIYSKKDELVGWTDVRDHASDARAQGYAVSEEMFEGTAHVTHMRADPARYWAIVEKTWTSHPTVV